MSLSDGAYPRPEGCGIAPAPRKLLSALYSTTPLDGTNDVWFARKLGDHLEVGTERRRVDGERVNLYTGITLTEAGERLLDAANKSDE